MAWPEVGEIIEAQVRGDAWERVSVLKVDGDDITVMWPPEGYDPSGGVGGQPPIPKTKLKLWECRPDSTPS